MKKFLFNGLLLTIMCVGTFGLQKKVMSTSSVFSSLMLENVEALTDVELPEVVITCDTQGWGKCYTQLGLTMKGEYMYYPCRFNEDPNSFCPEPRYHE